MKKYTEERPSIPAEIERAVKVEAGHKCAITTCNEKNYLKVHHINENREDNRVENLLLVCGPHHDMCHDGTIDRKSQYQYKELLRAHKNNTLSYIRAQEADRVVKFLKEVDYLLRWTNGDQGMELIFDDAWYWFPIEIYNKTYRFLYEDYNYYLHELRSHDNAARNTQDHIVENLRVKIEDISKSNLYKYNGGYAIKLNPNAPHGIERDQILKSQENKIMKKLNEIFTTINELEAYTESR